MTPPQPAHQPEWRSLKTRSGDVTVLQNGRALHSRFDPVREAEKAASTVPPDAGIVVLAGLGLGYVAEALVRNAPDRLLVIAEADPTIPERAASLRDLSALFNHPSVTLIAGGDPANLSTALTGGATGSAIEFLPWRPSTDTDPEWYRRLKEVVDETARRRLINARTLKRFGGVWVRNLAANAAILAETLPLHSWENRFLGIPALVFAGGPSLEMALPHLGALAERHVLICVDTALGALVRAGTRPDIVVAVDPQYWNTRHLDWCGEEAGDAPILAEASTHPAVFRHLSGRPWFIRTRFPLGAVLEDAAGIHGELRAGGSVATAAWDLARYLGCSPLTLSGLDLGFPERRIHYAGALSGERPHHSSQRVNPAETQLFHALWGAGTHAVRAAGGGMVLTDQRMDVYAAWFAESVSSMPERRPSVLGGSGRAVSGLSVATIEELLQRPFCRNRVNALLDELKNSPVDPETPARISRAIERIVAALARLESLANRGRNAAEKALRAAQSGLSDAEALKTMNAVDADLLSGDGLDVVSFLIQPIIQELSAQNDGADPLSDSQRLYKSIADSARYNLSRLTRKSPASPRHALGKTHQ